MLDRSVSTANRHTVRRSSREAVAALQGLGSRPYTRVALARPTPRSAAIDTLDAYEDARLITHWTQRGGAEVCAAAALAVGADGPVPVELFTAASWQIVPGGALLRRSVLTPLPQCCRGAQRGRGSLGNSRSCRFCACGRSPRERPASGRIDAAQPWPTAAATPRCRHARIAGHGALPDGRGAGVAALRLVACAVSCRRRADARLPDQLQSLSSSRRFAAAQPGGAAGSHHGERHAQLSSPGRRIRHHDGRGRAARRSVWAGGRADLV